MRADFGGRDSQKVNFSVRGRWLFSSSFFLLPRTCILSLLSVSVCALRRQHRWFPSFSLSLCVSAHECVCVLSVGSSQKDVFVSRHRNAVRSAQKKSSYPAEGSIEELHKSIAEQTETDSCAVGKKASEVQRSSRAARTSRVAGARKENVRPTTALHW